VVEVTFTVAFKIELQIHVQAKIIFPIEKPGRAAAEA